MFYYTNFLFSLIEIWHPVIQFLMKQDILPNNSFLSEMIYFWDPNFVNM